MIFDFSFWLVAGAVLCREFPLPLDPERPASAGPVAAFYPAGWDPVPRFGPVAEASVVDSVAAVVEAGWDLWID